MVFLPTFLHLSFFRSLFSRAECGARFCPALTADGWIEPFQNHPAAQL
jgi:hypothetical protein